MNFTNFYISTFTKFKQNAIKLITGALLFFVPLYIMSLAGDIGLVLMLIFGGYLMLCASRYFLKIVSGEIILLTDFFVFDKLKILSSLILGIVLVVFSGFWSIILVIPGVFVFSTLSMSFNIMVDQEINDPLECVKQSYALTKNKIWQIVIANLILIVLCVALIIIFSKLIILVSTAVWYVNVSFHLGGYLLIELLKLANMLIGLFLVCFMFTMQSVIYINLNQETDINKYQNYEVR
ncbi:MAG: hypothetical protein WCX32_03605 [Clostridia bacterium]|jgi:hypothetical protein|nr:hypothetical protein [Clostridia bacterium]MDD4275451.1 hypothetical protein [Clostridia bacterium]